MAGSPLDVAREVERTLGATSRAITAAIKASMKEAGDVARKELNATASLVPGADKQFSNMRRAGKLRVKIRNEPSAIVVTPVGPWGLAERGASPHAGSAWGRGRTKHPGTRGKQGRKAWSRGRDETLRKLEREIPEQIASDVERAFNAS